MSDERQPPAPSFCTPGPIAADVAECAAIVAAEYAYWRDQPEQAGEMSMAAMGAAANILCAINGFRAPWHPKPTNEVPY